MFVLKQCTKCKTFKEESDFCKNKNTKDGLSFVCKDCSNTYYKQNRIKILEQQTQYRKQNYVKQQKHNDFIKNKIEIYKKRRLNYKLSLKIQLNTRMEKVFYDALRYNKDINLINLVNYNVSQLKQHLENQFTPEMSWDNYGSYWEIDHIIPKNCFNYEKPEDYDFKICWSLLNLRPLSKQENKNRKRSSNLFEYNDISEELKQQILNQKLGQKLSCDMM